VQRRRDRRQHVDGLRRGADDSPSLLVRELHEQRHVADVLQVRPGGRPPHAWLDDGRSLFDLFHTEWTLLALGPDAPATEAFEAAARELAMDLRVVRLAQPALRELYEAPLALIRPDQIVAWRGADADADEAARVLSRVTSTPSTSSVDATRGDPA
jgi:hypothetical protein